MERRKKGKERKGKEKLGEVRFELGKLSLS